MKTWRRRRKLNKYECISGDLHFEKILYDGNVKTVPSTRSSSPRSHTLIIYAVNVRPVPFTKCLVKWKTYWKFHKFRRYACPLLGVLNEIKGPHWLRETYRLGCCSKSAMRSSPRSRSLFIVLIIHDFIRIPLLEWKFQTPCVIWIGICVSRSIFA